jgi:hypothetical protein
MKSNMKNVNQKRLNRRSWCKVLSLTLLSLFSSCEKFVEVDLPNSQLIGTKVFNDANTANAAIADFYINLRDEVLVTGSVNGLSVALGYYADELTHYSVDRDDYFQNSLNPLSFSISENWNNCYKLIYEANSVLEGVEQSTALTESDKQSFAGEALFMRAYVHFYLLNLYGSIPYVTSTNYERNSRITKASPESVYTFILADLTLAKAYLKDDYVTEERVRPNRSVVSALMARVYLYTQNWEAAKKEASDIIGHSDVYSMMEDLDKTFLKNSSSTLWQLMPNAPGVNTHEAGSFIFVTGPPTYRAVSTFLLAAFEEGDLRKTHWLGSVTKGSDTWYYPFKYKQNKNTGTSQEYSILFRLEELYLIRAEAAAHLGQLAEAKSDLNRIRKRAGLENTIATTEAELLQAILRERRVEFFTELGHRWFDLKRTGQADAVLSVAKAGWDTRDILWPLPENDLRLNPGLRPQNAGYN